MNYTATPNLLLEALAYLGARANGYNQTWMEGRLRMKGIQDLSAFYHRYEPIAAIGRELDALIPSDQEWIGRLFRDLEGFSFNTTGMYSPAYLLFFPFLERYEGDLDALTARMTAQTPEEAARSIFISLGMDDGEPGGTDYMETVFSLTIPAESRLALLETHHHYQSLIRETAEHLRPLIGCLEAHREQLQRMADAFGAELAEAGCMDHLRQTTNLDLDAGIHYKLRPFIFGSDSNLCLEPSVTPGTVTIHCGVLVRFLRKLFDDARGSGEQVFEAIRLLGDPTRFEILCFLRDRPAYGSELSEKLGFARNTIHHHTSKLLNAGLLTYTVEGNRIRYSTNKERLSSLLAQQHHLLIGTQGW